MRCPFSAFMTRRFSNGGALPHLVGGQVPVLWQERGLSVLRPRSLLRPVVLAMSRPTPAPSENAGDQEHTDDRKNDCRHSSLQGWVKQFARAIANEHRDTR